MLVTKLVIRIIGKDNEMLGWAEVAGEARGDGCLRIASPVSVGLQVAGTPAYLSVHWCDVNVEVRQPMAMRACRAGEIITLPFTEPAIVCGPAAGGLPPVEVSAPISVGVPVGAVGARA